MSVPVRIKLDDNAAVPSYRTAGSAGADISSAEDIVIAPGRSAMVSTGIHPEIPAGYEIQVRPRSGLAARHSVTVLSEIKVILINHGTEPFEIHRGDRIAQLVLAPVAVADFIAVDEISGTERGAGGFGSTGV